MSAKVEYTYTIDFEGDNYTLESIVEIEDVLKNGVSVVLNAEIAKWLIFNYGSDTYEKPIFGEVLDRRNVE
jgi:hypothetical protein